MKKNKIFLKLVLIISLLTSTIIPYAANNAYAGLNSLFANSPSFSSNSGGAGSYSVQGENIYTLGYSEVHFGIQQGNIQLISVTPPSFSIGCSGIDATFGAFAMLGQKLLTAVKSIISSGTVLVFAFNMALGILCKQCQQIMNQIEAIANKLNGLNFNSCQVAEAAAGWAGQDLNLLGGSGQTNSWSNSINTALSNANKTVKTYVEDINCTISNGDQIYQQAASGTTVTPPANFDSCGQQAAIDNFKLGSALRFNLVGKNTGILGTGTTTSSSYSTEFGGPTSPVGGNMGLLGILRGIVGDVYGYNVGGPTGPTSSGTTSTGKSSPEVKYISPPLPTKFVASCPSEGTVNNATSYNSYNDINSFVFGGCLTYDTTSSTVVDDYETVDPSDYSITVGPKGYPLMTAQTKCFEGFINYYLIYLNQAYCSITGQAVPGLTLDLPKCEGDAVTTLSCSGSNSGTALTTTQSNLLANSSLPLNLILKLTYETRDPSLIEQASDVMAYSSASSFLKNGLEAINGTWSISSLAKKGVSKQFEELQTVISKQIQNLNSIDNNYLKTMALKEKQLNYYENLNAEVQSLYQENNLLVNPPKY